MPCFRIRPNVKCKKSICEFDWPWIQIDLASNKHAKRVFQFHYSLFKMAISQLDKSIDFDWKIILVVREWQVSRLIFLFNLLAFTEVRTGVNNSTIPIVRSKFNRKFSFSQFKQHLVQYELLDNLFWSCLLFSPNISKRTIGNLNWPFHSCYNDTKHR